MRTAACISAFIAAVFLSASAFSLEYSAGVMAWYAWWQPHFEEELRGVDNPFKRDNPGLFGDAYNDSFSVDPAFLIGPVANARLSDSWSIGIVFLASSEYTGHAGYQVDYLSGPVPYSIETDFKVRRYDTDLTLTHRINQYFGFFAGYKYSHYRGTGSHHVTSLSTSDSYDVERTGTMHGPGFGINIMLPLVDTFFVSASFSALYMRSRWIYRATNNTTGVETEEALNRRLWGYNIIAGPGYYSPLMRTTFLAGGRYQYLVDTEDSALTDRFYGIIFSAIYSF